MTYSESDFGRDVIANSKVWQGFAITMTLNVIIQKQRNQSRFTIIGTDGGLEVSPPTIIGSWNKRDVPILFRLKISSATKYSMLNIFFYA